MDHSHFFNETLIREVMDKSCLYLDIVIGEVGTAVAQWLRCCATKRKVAGSIPDGVIGIFH